jgi:soluble lytic murein transglycosylase-like protein
MPSCLARGERFHPLIVRVSREHNVDPALVKAIIMAESGYNPQAVSKEGAGGLMQLMPRTADSLGVQDIFDPEENVSGGVKYLKQLLNEFGEIKLALAAYNAGSRKVRSYNGVPPIGATQVYIKKVIEYYQHYRKRFTGPRETA